MFNKPATHLPLATCTAIWTAHKFEHSRQQQQQAPHHRVAPGTGLLRSQAKLHAPVLYGGSRGRAGAVGTPIRRMLMPVPLCACPRSIPSR